MREEEEHELPSPDELMPISQTLITLDLALAFNIIPTNHNHNHHHHNPFQHPNQSEPITTTTNNNNNNNNSSSSPEQDQARTLKRPRLVWTPQLHKRFVDAVAHLGIKNAVPKTIMQLMSVDGLTRENIASHLQKYRLYIKRVQGINSGSGGDSDPATDRLFASAPVPAHFLHQAAATAGYVGPTVAEAVRMPEGQYSNYHGYYQGHIGHFGSSNNNGYVDSFSNGQFENHIGVHSSMTGGFVDDVENGSANGRKVLTLFPTGDA